MRAVFAVEELVRRDLQGLKPYNPHYAPDVIRLDANENPLDFPAEVKDYIISGMGKQFFGRYPDPLARDLVSQLAAHFGVGTENIMVGNGSDELILDIMLAFGAGKRVIIASPTFSMYAIHARVAGAVPVDVPRGPDFEVDIGAMIKAAGDEPGVMVLCNPNNPSGNATDVRDIGAIAGSVKSLLVVDEAYVEFGGESCVPLLDKYPNLAVMRTFSKAFGLAGMRVGYLLADSRVVRELLRIKQPFNVNSFSQLAARSAMRFKDLMAAQVREIIGLRNSLAQKLREVPGVKLYPSETNFILFNTVRPEDEVHRELLDKGVMVRYIEAPGRGKFLRVSVGTQRENDVFLDSLRSVLTGG
ncbi:MAG: histidinol-phosphate transaminase [Bacillota bacterium]